MNSTIGSSGLSSSSHLNLQRQVQKQLLTTPFSLIGKLLSLPDRYPHIRYAYDISILAIAIISIVGILIASQGQGLLLFGLIPGFVLGALGMAMLVSDIAKTPKMQKIADTLTAIFLPFILLSVASGLLAAAFLGSGGSILVVANPLFLMGIMTIGLSLISLHKVTFQHFKTEALIKEQKKIAHIADQPSTPLYPSQSSSKDEKILALEKKKQLAAEAKQAIADQQARSSVRNQRLRKNHQGNIRRQNSIVRFLSNGYDPDSSSDNEVLSSNNEMSSLFTNIPLQKIQRSLSLTSTSSSQNLPPLGNAPLPTNSSLAGNSFGKNSWRLYKIEKSGSKQPKNQDQEDKDEEESASNKRKEPKKKKPGKKKR